MSRFSQEIVGSCERERRPFSQDRKKRREIVPILIHARKSIYYLLCRGAAISGVIFVCRIESGCWIGFSQLKINL
jgi:hypothetical protein